MNNNTLYIKMRDFAQTLPAGGDRAQAYNIARRLQSLDLKESSMADMMINDNLSVGACLRNSILLVDAGLATEKKGEKPHLFGEFTFCDGSKLNEL